MPGVYPRSFPKNEKWGGAVINLKPAVLTHSAIRGGKLPGLCYAAGGDVVRACRAPQRCAVPFTWPFVNTSGKTVEKS